jgi:hypothetical protein
MSLGPILIFDKSFLQSLNVDEAVWLDNFFLTVITPLFFVETLADLEKEVHRGRTPEQVVGSLAYKTPDLQSYMAAHHGTLLWADLHGQKVPMDGRIPRAGGRYVTLDGKQGVVYERTPEEEAFTRWQRHEFLDLERQIAKVWRRNVTNIDHTGNYALFSGFYESFRKPKTLSDAKHIADTLISLLDEEKALPFGLSMLGVPAEDHGEIVQRWTAAGKPLLREYASYFMHMFSVDFFFHLAIAADLISRVRPEGKADNKVDIAYLYYLPFCMVFVSSDNLHKRVVPLFLRPDQSFVGGPDLKADLKRIDEFYTQLPKEQTDQGVYKFATSPPDGICPKVKDLWDKHLTTPRVDEEEAEGDEEVEVDDEPEQAPPKDDKALIDMINRAQSESTPLDLDPENLPDIDDIQFAHVSRLVVPKKGKWIRVRPPGLDDDGQSKSS